MFVACASNDSPVVVPDTEQLQDGVWTGSGEGRSGTIIVKVTVENHQVTKVTVVSQSESTFAQETINSLCENAVGRYRSQWSLGGYCCCLLRQTI